MKKIIATLLTLGMIAASSVSVFAVANDNASDQGKASSAEHASDQGKASSAEGANNGNGNGEGDSPGKSGDSNGTPGDN